MIEAEHRIYNTLTELCSNYNGGFWNYYELSNGGFYVAPSSNEKFEVFINSNGYEGILSADAAGIIVSLYVINQLCWINQSEELVNYYYLLLDYVAQHPDAKEIYAAID